MTHHVALTELASALSLGMAAVALIALVLAFAPANLAYFDLRRADESPRALPVLVTVANARYRLSRRDNALLLAGLLALFSPVPEATS